MDEYNHLKNIKKVGVGHLLSASPENVSVLNTNPDVLFSHLTTRLRRRGANICGLSCLTSRGGSASTTTALEAPTTVTLEERRLRLLLRGPATHQPSGMTPSVYQLERGGVGGDEENTATSFWNHLGKFLKEFLFSVNVRSVPFKASGMVFFVFY